MATGQTGKAIRRVRSVVLRRDEPEPTDAELLADYLDSHNGEILAALVRRHAAMVWGVCRRVLRNQHDAEDAFQATFLVLVRKATSIASPELLANWLYGVAHQTALKARATAAKRGTRERQVTAMPEPAATERDLWADLQPLLDQELSRLPEKYRSAIVLCDLEGKTRREAARHLGVPEGTLAARLARARTMLAKRLTRHGLVVSGGALGAAVSQGSALAGVPNSVVSTTIKAASLFAADQAVTTGVVSTTVTTLANGVLKAMMLHKLKLTAVALTATLAVVGLGLLAGDLAVPTAVARQPEARKEKAARPAEPKAAPTWEAGPKLDGHKDWIFGITFSRDGKLMATASRDGTAIVWDVAKNKAIVTLQGHEGTVHHIAFSPDGKFVVTAGEDQTARVWEIPKGQEVQKITHKHPIYSVIFSPDGKTFLAGGGTVAQSKRGNREAVEGQGELRLWDPATGKERGSATGHAGRVSHLILSSDGKTLVSGGADNTVRIWEWDGNDKLTEKQSIEAGVVQGVYGAALAPDGKTVAVATDGGTIKLFDVETAKEKDKLEKVAEGMWDDVTFSSDGKVLAANYWIQERDGDFMVTRRSQIRFWDAATGKVLQTVEVKEVIERVAFVPEGHTLVAGGRGTLKYQVTMGGIKSGDIEEDKAGPLMIFTPKKDK